jgi:hypothetical protein
VERGGDTPSGGDGALDMIKMALRLMDSGPSSSKAPKEDPNAELRTALRKAQVKAAEEQAKILAEQAKGAYANGRADILLRMLDSAHLSAEQRKEVLDQLFLLSSAP